MRFFVCLFLSFALVVTVAVQAQEVLAPTTAAVALKEVPAEHKLALKELQVVVLQRALAESNYKVVAQQLKDIQTNYEKLTGDLNSQVDALYAKLGLKRDEYDINFETGAIVKITAPPQPPVK